MVELSNVTGTLKEEENETERKMPCEDTDTHREEVPYGGGGRDWSGTATSQIMPRATRSWRRQGRILP